MDKKYDSSNLFLKGYKYDVLYKKDEEKSKSQREETIAERVKLRLQKLDNEDLSDMPPLEGDDEEAKEGKGLKVLTPNKLLSRLPILLAQTKAGNKSFKLKNEIRKILYLLYQHNKIESRHYNHGRKYDRDKRSQKFLF